MRLRLERRCAARITRRESPTYFGRCDLHAGHDGPHWLERGMDEVKFVIEVVPPFSPTEPPPRPGDFGGHVPIGEEAE